MEYCFLEKLSGHKEQVPDMGISGSSNERSSILPLQKGNTEKMGGSQKFNTCSYIERENQENEKVECFKEAIQRRLSELKEVFLLKGAIT